MGRKRRCRYEGCRAGVRGNGEWCVAHPNGEPRRVGGGTPGNQNARKHGLYSAYVPVVALERALEVPPGDVRLEIAAARAVLAELLESGLPATEIAGAFDRATGALARLLRTNRQLDDEAGRDEMQDGIGLARKELGLGGVQRVMGSEGEERAPQRHGEMEGEPR